jgi:hypothetical protein
MSARGVGRRRRLAAAQVLGAPGDAAVQSLSSDTSDPPFAEEVTAMRHIARLLEELPTDAWALSAVSQPEPRATRGLGWAERHRRLALPLAAAAVVICLALGFAGGALVTQNGGGSAGPQASQSRPIVLRPVTSAVDGSLAVAFMSGPGQMVVHIDHLPPSAPGTYYELWLMTDARHLTPVAAFQIGPAGAGRLRLRLPDRASHYRYLDISLQRLDGGTAHSGDSVLRGRIT